MSTRALKPLCSGRRRQRGAALLVLLTMLILGVAAVAVNAFRSNAGAREAQALHVLGETREALIGFAVTHGRLPRPALSAESGIELSTPCDSEQRCTGFVPWSTLSLAPTYARGQPLRYSVTPAFAADGAVLSTAVATKTIAARTGMQLIYLHGSERCARNAQCLPVVLIAPGKFPGVNGGDQTANLRSSVHFIERPFNDDERVEGGVFDDVVALVPYSELRVRMLQAGNWR
jgi:type II secretory pathway pseudopilin PulG